MAEKKKNVDEKVTQRETWGTGRSQKIDITHSKYFCV